jgi:poly(A) polymerase Pap1
MVVDSDYKIETLEREAAKKEFFEILERQGYDMYDIDEETTLPKCLVPIIKKKDLNSFILFNSMLEHVHVDHGISVIDMCTYLIEEFFEPEQLLTLLQTNLYDALYLELRKKKGANVEKLSKFLIR